MKTKLKMAALAVALMQSVAFAQRIGFDQIDDSKVAPWIPESTAEYQYVYRFGASEKESDFLLLSGIDGYCAQIRSSEWRDEGESWVWRYENLNNVRIEGNQFFSDKTNGEFVIYDNGREKTKGLKVYNPWSGLTENGEYEIGTKSYPAADYFSGEFPQASLRRLGGEELRKMPKSDIKTMRNEIFARYGYIFKSGGEMDLYFGRQDWYSGRYENIDAFLTDLERQNIKLMLRIENE
jgi:hypothetical protein